MNSNMNDTKNKSILIDPVNIVLSFVGFISRDQRLKSEVCVFVAENTRARSDEFAVKNGLPKFEYVLHPRTTGFTFIVETLRKGQSSIPSSFSNKRGGGIKRIHPVSVKSQTADSSSCS